MIFFLYFVKICWPWLEMKNQIKLLCHAKYHIFWICFYMRYKCSNGNDSHGQNLFRKYNEISTCDVIFHFKNEQSRLSRIVWWCFFLPKIISTAHYVVSMVHIQLQWCESPNLIFVPETQTLKRWTDNLHLLNAEILRGTNSIVFSV